MHNTQYTSTVSRGILQQAKEDCPDRVHSDQIVLGTIKQEAGPSERRTKVLKTKVAQEGA
jgi:hypothetical protein